MSGFSDIGYSISDSTYDVTFDLPSRARIQLIGTVTSDRTLVFGYGESRVQLYRDATVIFSAFAEPDSAPTQAFAFDQVLDTGRYRIVVKADGDVGMLGAFDFVLAADPPPPAVPFLSPIAMLGMLAILLNAGRREIRLGLVKYGAPWKSRQAFKQ